MSLQIQTNRKIASYTQAIEIRDQIVWQGMECLTVGDALETWLHEIPNKLTKKNYICAINKLTEAGLIKPGLTLQAFALIQHSQILKKIKQQPQSEATNQARAAAYISFTRHLSEKFEGNFNRANPIKDPMQKTFSKVRETVATQAMDCREWTAFLEELQKINARDCLIAKITLQGAKRIGEVLSLTIDKINWELCQITFKQSKTGSVERETIITYSPSLMAELKTYIQETDHLRGNDDLVFITRTGKKVSPVQVQGTFAQAGVAAGIGFKVSPHCLRASAITEYKKRGMSDTDIVRVSGHANIQMMAAYDKSNKADNASRKISLI